MISFKIIYIFLINFYIFYEWFYKMRIMYIPFTNLNNEADCYDVCYFNKAYCLEFYDLTNGLEYSCGKGEDKYFNDTIGGSQYAIPGDKCVCLYDPNIPNIDPFINCTSENPC